MSHARGIDTEARLCFNGGMASTTPTTQPDKGYYTLDITTQPWQGRDGFTITTKGEWGVSTSSLCKAFSSQSVIDEDDGMVTLKVYKVRLGEMTEYHPLNGTQYVSKEAADQAAYEAGLTSYWFSTREGS